MIEFIKPWAYVENGRTVSVPARFVGEIPANHAKDAIKGGFAKPAKDEKEKV